jgi:hypothetical protein
MIRPIVDVSLKDVSMTMCPDLFPKNHGTAGRHDVTLPLVRRFLLYRRVLSYQGRGRCYGDKLSQKRVMQGTHRPGTDCTCRKCNEESAAAEVRDSTLPNFGLLPKNF